MFVSTNPAHHDNDNDTLREVPHPSNEGQALQARVSGPWPHKRNLSCWYIAHWQGAQVQTVKRQNVVQRYLKWTQVQRERKSNMNHRQLLRWIRELFTESSDSEQHHGQNTKTTRSPETRGRSQETRRNKGTREADGRIPQYSSRSCCCSQILFFRTRSIRNPDISFCWEPVTYFLIVLCPRSPSTWPLHCFCFRLHNALDRCAAAALFKDPRCIFLFCHFTHFPVYFLQVESILSGLWQYWSRCCCFDSFFQVIPHSLFRQGFVWGNRWCHLPIFSLAYRSFCWSFFLKSAQGSIQQLFLEIFHSVMLRFSMLISISFFCVFCSSIESLHVPSCQ